MINPFLTKPNYIRIYGHRGARGDIVENSISGFKYTFDLGIKAVEFDFFLADRLANFKPNLNGAGKDFSCYFTANRWAKFKLKLIFPKRYFLRACMISFGGCVCEM